MPASPRSRANSKPDGPPPTIPTWVCMGKSHLELLPTASARASPWGNPIGPLPDPTLSVLGSRPPHANPWADQALRRRMGGDNQAANTSCAKKARCDGAEGRLFFGAALTAQPH